MYERGKLSPSLFVESVPVEVEAWRKALMDAAELIRTFGLAKGIRCDLAGRVCVQGAISRAVNGDPDRAVGETDRAATRALASYLRERGDHTVSDYGCARWNNVPSRTAAEVIAALEGAARS